MFTSGDGGIDNTPGSLAHAPRGFKAGSLRPLPEPGGVVARTKTPPPADRQGRRGKTTLADGD
jgi:hypothetical protein